jgi:GMP synthase (glutamine-hydrolysing)
MSPLHSPQHSPQQILVIQNGALDPIGLLGESLVQRGAELSIWQAWSSEQEIPEEPDYSSVIILGGSMNACEDDKFPHLSQIVQLIRQFHAADKPVMGVCLGAQLIARTFGARVHSLNRPEIGYSPLEVVVEDAPEDWLRTCPPDLHCMQWHSDTFDLPEQATLLMTNGSCRNQAFRIGSKIYGFQFHPEVTPDIVMSWLVMNTAQIETHYPNLEQQFRQQIQRYAKQSAQFADEVGAFWMQLLDPATSVSAAIST